MKKAAENNFLHEVGFVVVLPRESDPQIAPCPDFSSIVDSNVDFVVAFNIDYARTREPYDYLHY